MPRTNSRRTFLQQAAAIGSVAVMTASARNANAAPPKIKVGQIGTGHAHATKLEVYRKSEAYEVVGVVEPNEELRRKAMSQPAYRDLPFMTEEQLLNTAGLQAVLVETEVRDLLDTAERAIAAGKHVHLDKPAGSSLPQYKRLLTAAEKQKLLVQMGYMFRYSPAVQLLRKFLAEGWLGELFEVQTVMSKVSGPADRKKFAEFRGGIMFELGCHVVDLVVMTLGKPDRVSSFARQTGFEQDDCYDNMLAVCEYPKAIASVKSAAVDTIGFARRQLTVCGRHGSFHIQPLDAPNVTYSLTADHGEYRKGTHEIKFGNYPRYVGDAEDMAKIIRGEKESDYSYEHDLAVQETVLRASGMPVE